MWTLKSKTAGRKTVQELVSNNEPIGRSTMIFLQFILTNGTSDVELATYVTTLDEIEEAILQNLERLNGQEGVIEKVNAPDWVPARKTTEVVTEPNLEQVIAEKEVEVQVEADRVRREKEFAELATQDAVLASKLGELTALRENAKNNSPERKR